jgi:hypothetical protein
MTICVGRATAGSNASRRLGASAVLTAELILLAFKRRTFETAVTRAGRSLFKCPLLLCQFLLGRFH